MKDDEEVEERRVKCGGFEREQKGTRKKGEIGANLTKQR